MFDAFADYVEGFAAGYAAWEWSERSDLVEGLTLFAEECGGAYLEGFNANLAFLSGLFARSLA